MNKITSTLAGLAVVATASIAPAFAQGQLFTPPGTFTFSFLGGGNVFTAQSTSVGYNPIVGGAATTAAFSLVGVLTGTPGIYNVSSLLVTPTGGSPFLDSTGTFLVTPLSGGGEAINSITPAADGTSFNLATAPPVPEASTVISFGALLALGGLAVVLRRKGVKNVA